MGDKQWNIRKGENKGTSSQESLSRDQDRQQHQPTNVEGSPQRDGDQVSAHGVIRKTAEQKKPQQYGDPPEDCGGRPQQTEAYKETDQASQQSGFMDEAMLAKGVAGNPQKIKLQLVHTVSYFSEEEKDFFMAAAIEGEIGQTHYTNPDADTCYRCPLCARVLNPNGLERHTVRHFLRMHNTPNREYIATLHEEPWKQISFQTGGNTARRNGADPPPIALIQDHEDQVGRRKQTSQVGVKRKVLKPKSKLRARTSKKKRRPSGQPTDQKARGSKGVKRCPIRKISGKTAEAHSEKRNRPNVAEKSDKDPREPNKEAKHIEPKLTAQLQKKSKGKVQWKR